MSETIAAVMPTYRHANLIEAALDSIAHQVDLLVVVDDASPDDTCDVLTKWFDRNEACDVCVFTHNEQNLGTAMSINKGIEIIEKLMPGADWWTWVSSDNVHMPEWANSLLAAARQGDGVVYSGFNIVKPHKKVSSLGYFIEHEPDKLVSTPNCYYGPSFIIRPAVWQYAGPHRGQGAHDFDHWTRVEEACWDLHMDIRGIKKPLVKYLRHAETTIKRDPAAMDQKKWRDEAIKRRAKT